MNIKIIPDLGLMLKALGMLREHLAKTNMDHSTRILQITEEFLADLQRMLPRLQAMFGVMPSDSAVSEDEVAAFIASIK